MIFIASLADYMKVAAEDEKTNRMVEAFKVFEDVAKDKNLGHVPIQLFLNKSDLFADLIKKYDLNCVPEFSDYKGGADFDAAVKYFQDKFAAINERVRPGEHIDPYVTCATDSEKFHVIIGNCEKAILMKNLEEAGVGL